MTTIRHSMIVVPAGVVAVTVATGRYRYIPAGVAGFQVVVVGDF
jgi:hypothetical protein